MIILMIIVASLPTAAEQGNFDKRIGEVVDKINKIYKIGGNVTLYVNQLNKAIKLYYEGNMTGFNKTMNMLEDNLTVYESKIKEQYKYRVVEKTMIIIFLILIPVLTYYGLPRIYLYYWYKSREKWLIIGEKESDNG